MPKKYIHPTPTTSFQDAYLHVPKTAAKKTHIDISLQGAWFLAWQG